MANFRFKLEPVLRHRCLIEDECQRELAKALRHQLILRGQLRQMQQTIVESKRRLGDGLIGRVNLDQIAQFARYSGQVTQRAHGIVARLAAAEKQIQTARERLLHAARDRKALELLRDRQHRRWQEMQGRREAASMDELAVQGFARLALGDL